jgi:AraC-like DNA-binding protein
MMISSFSPSPALAPYVIDYCVYDISAADRSGAPARVTTMPDTLSVACFLYGDPVQAAHKNSSSASTRSAISGFQTYRFDIEGQGRQAGVTARFTAWGARCFFPDSAEAFVDVRVDYRDLFLASRVEALEDQLHALGSAAERARCVDAFLLAHLRPRALDRVVRATALAIWKRGGLVTMEALADEAELSQRTLERRFLSVVGVGPKKFARVVRLQNALKRYPQIGSWTDTAFATGYADQSHLIRECRAMLGESPEVLFAKPSCELSADFEGAKRSPRAMQA